MKQTLAVIKSNREVYPGVYLMWLESKSGAKKSKPGQFFMVKCGDETILRRPLSLHLADKENGRVAFLYAVVGKGTEWLTSCLPGEMVDILGPLGNDFKLAPKTENVLLVAGGIGIAPLCNLAETAVQAGKKVTLLLGAATIKKLYPKKFLPAGVKVVYATDDGTRGHKGLVTDLIPEYVGKADRIYICGPMPMFKYIAGHQAELGLTGKYVEISMEMRMACGIGVCYGCTIRTKNGLKEVCKDGPVFKLADVIWDEMTQI